jgi:hypothetical protein
MIELLEQLLEQDFEDMFEPASDEEAMSRVEYMWEDILKWLEIAHNQSITMAHKYCAHLNVNYTDIYPHYGHFYHSGIDLTDEKRNRLIGDIKRLLKKDPKFIYDFWHDMGLEDWIDRPSRKNR